MSRLLRAAALISVIASAVQAQAPAPTGVVSSASFTIAGLPNAGIAQGSIFTVFGKNMGPTTLVQNTSMTLPTTAGLSGTVITVTVAGVTTTCPMVFTSAGQLAAILPSTTPVGTGTLSVTYNGVTGATTPITVAATNLSLYTLNQVGTGPAVVQDFTNNLSIVTVTNSAAPGDTVQLYGTGFGALPAGQNDAVNPPTQVNLANTPIQVTVGGLLLASTAVTYHGRSGMAGLDQINFVVPANLSGCYLPIIVQTGTGASAIVSNSATLAVAAKAGTTCTDPTGLPVSSITPSSNGTFSIGAVSLLQTTVSIPGAGTQVSSIGAGSFYQYTSQQFNASGSFSGQPSLGGCIVYDFNVGSSTTPPVTGTGLNAGPSLSVTGPNSLTLNLGATGAYSGIVSGALAAGTYNVIGPGGTGAGAVGAFSAPITLPTSFSWSNQSAAATITRSAGQVVNWTGGSSNSYVVIVGSSSTGTTTGVGAAFTCIVPLAAGSFTIPASVLLSLPASATGAGVLQVGNYTNPVPFGPPSGLNYAYTITGAFNVAQVSYQ